MFQPLMEYVRACSGEMWGITFDKGWTFRSACTPDLEQELKRLETSLDRIPAGMKMKLGMEGRSTDVRLMEWSDAEARSSWRFFMKGRLGAPTKDMLDELREAVSGLVCAPMDKNADDAVL